MFLEYEFDIYIKKRQVHVLEANCAIKKKSVYGLIRIKILYKVWFEGKEWLDV